ncbi:Uncharacterised protein [Shigella sonnei]|nr:Uncharacterised protein [Shigella sonnei]
MRAELLGKFHNARLTDAELFRHLARRDGFQLTHVGPQKVSNFLLVLGKFTFRIAYFRQVQHLPLSRAGSKNSA